MSEIARRHHYDDSQEVKNYLEDLRSSGTSPNGGRAEQDKNRIVEDNEEDQ